MPISKDITSNFISYTRNFELSPLFLLGDALSILQCLPDQSIDLCMTSPPYWGKRQYSNGGLGLEEDYEDYIIRLVTVFAQVKRVLKPEGSFWLNIGDS
ncbi:MAG: DNA methyltransferase, partial [Chloroflexota bacterium]